jgi:hypothetical protein
VAGKWQASGRQVAGKWQASGRQVAGSKSLLFLKKKKQKNFFHMRPGGRESRLLMDEVFCFFLFTKRRFFLPLAFFGFSGERSILSCAAPWPSLFQKKKTLAATGLSSTLKRTGKAKKPCASGSAGRRNSC